jgi:hypothetical protein
MKKRKLFAFLTAVSVVLSSFAGICSAEEENSEAMGPVEETSVTDLADTADLDVDIEEPYNEAAQENEETDAEAFMLTGEDDIQYFASGDNYYTVDFDSVGFSVVQTQMGWSNTASGHQDKISGKTVDGGLEGKGFEVSYSTAAAWYSGAVFINRPSNWVMSSDLKTITFSVKGSGNFKIGLTTDNAINGKSFEQTVKIDSPNEWTDISLRVSDFKNGGTSVDPADVVGISFKSADGTIPGAQDVFKGYDGEAVLAAVKTGSIIIDNFTITTEGEEVVVPDSMTVDFDNVGFSVAQTQSGWTNDASGHKDTISGKTVDGGLEGKGFEVSYSTAAAWYNGVVYINRPSNWVMSPDLRTITFSVKGTGNFKIGLVTEKVIDGKVFEQTVNIDSPDEWTEISLSIGNFKNGGTIVNPADVVGISFKSADGTIQGAQDVFRDYDGDAVLAAVKEGSIIIDNFTITKEGEEIIPPEANLVDFDEFGLSSVGTYSGWSRSDGTYKDFISGSIAEGEGVEGNGYKIDYSQVSYYAGRLFFSFPSNFVFNKDINQIEFDIKGTGSLNMYLMENMVRNADYTVTFDSEYSTKINFDTAGEWQHITLSIYDIVKNSGAYPDMTKVNGIAFTPPGGGYDQNKLNTADMEQLLKDVKTGTAIIDNIYFSSVGEAPDLSNGTFVADFDTVGFGSGGQRWSGATKRNENNEVVYNDYVSCTTADEIGVDGSKGFQITYKQATYYGGEQFIAKPTNWNVNYDLKCIEFDAKGVATFNMNLETGSVINGTRYGKKFTINTTDAPNDGWQHFKIPLSEFTRTVDGEVVSIPVKDLVGFSITGPGGKYDNNKMDQWTVEELEAAANIGEVVIDNFTITTDDSNLAEPGPVTFKIDFDNSNFVGGDIFSGWTCAENGYSDYMKQSTVEGVEGNALRLDYQQATYYCGEIFKGFSSEWKMYDGLKTVEFDIKGKGSINMNLEEDTVVNGVRFGTVITADNEDEWTHVIIPIEQFRNSGVPVTPSKIVGMTFSGIGGSVDRDEMANFTKEELEAKASKGYVIIDNLAITMKEPDVAVESVSVNKAGGEEVTAMSELTAGETLTASMTLSQAIQGIGALTVGIYNNEGRLISAVSGDEIGESNTVSVEFILPEGAASIKLMPWKSMYNCIPLENEACKEIK